MLATDLHVVPKLKGGAIPILPPDDFMASSDITLPSLLVKEAFLTF